MLEIFKTKNFFLIFVFSSAIFSLVFINLNRSYISKADILIIFKSEKASQNAEIILENLATLPKNLSFYDQIVKNEKELENEKILELPDYKREKYWNKKIKIERIGKSSILNFSTEDKDLYVSEIMISQIVKNLLGIIGVYYDIKNDIDIRIINKPNAEIHFLDSYFSVILKSLLVGFLLSFTINYFLFLFSKNRSKIKPKENLTWSYSNSQKNPFDASANYNLENKQKEYIPIFSKKAVAPDNLPIAENIPTFKKTENKKEGMQEKIEKITLTHEATAEEVKERLNQLLSGKL